MLDEPRGEVGKHLLEHPLLQALSEALSIALALVQQPIQEAQFPGLTISLDFAGDEGVLAEEEPEVPERLVGVGHGQGFVQVDLIVVGGPGMGPGRVKTP